MPAVRASSVYRDGLHKSWGPFGQLADKLIYRRIDKYMYFIEEEKEIS